MNIKDILNVRYSTRNLSDKDFYDNLDSLALQLSTVDFKPQYSEEVLKKDWEKLCKFKVSSNDISSTSRIGMKLCEHFFPNFYDIKTVKHPSFSEMWGDVDLLKKVLIWNRKSHSTPYLSELKRGIYFCSGSTKSTMYRPQMAKIITNKCNSVFDPCAGWGGRMIGSVSNGCYYYAFEPNSKTYENLQRLISFLKIEKFVTIINDDARNCNQYDIPNVDCCLTSPPYYNLEIYTDEDSQSISNINSYEDWINSFLKPVILSCLNKLKPNGKSCWNVAKCGANDLWRDVNSIHLDNNYEYFCEYNVCSSKRQVNQKNNSEKSFDKTIQYMVNLNRNILDIDNISNSVILLK